MSRSILLYFLRTKARLFEKFRVKSISVNGNSSGFSDSLSVFNCHVDPSISWKVEGKRATSTWIPVCEQAASGLLFTSPVQSRDFQWSAELECWGRRKSSHTIATLSLNCNQGIDQGVIRLPISGDELFLYYLLAESYSPPKSNCGSPRSVHLVPVRTRPETLDKQLDPWPKKVPVLVGHGGAGAHRAHYGGGREWPENTICAFRRSEQLGLQMIECDATVTRDCGAVVLHHNFTLGLRSLPRNESFKGRSFVLDHLPDGPVTKDTKSLIAQYTLEEIRNLLGQASRNSKPHENDHFVHPKPLAFDDPEPDQDGIDGQPLPELNEAFRRTSTRLGFNVEMKYPRETLLGRITHALETGEPVTSDLPGPHNYFAQINKFCDKVLDVIWKNAGSRPVILSSFNADLCAVLRLKQSNFPVLFITRGGIPSSTEPPNMMHVDLRHCNLPVALSWAHMMNLSGVVTLGQHFGSTPKLHTTNEGQINALVADMQEKQLACLVYGDGVSELSFLKKATGCGLTGVIIDRVESYMQEYFLTVAPSA
ncbi:to multifunctional cyclin-dependent kinase [Fasciola hepatica]|uniref:To multifunctional cyclin-dependent kinase n=1 Tax=Fasciola hepatica TaxID=6192 RepID=A0A4E0R4J0_FASHE|nr:to multifunctional cyclin-dependent kinase [Fasciola hepatica]